MNRNDPAPQLANLHTTTGDDLDALLDIEAGLREATVVAQHTRTSRELSLGIEAGLQAIVPEEESIERTIPRHSSVEEHSVASWMMSGDSIFRLRVRTNSSIMTLALALEIDYAATATHALNLHHSRRVLGRHTTEIEQARALALARANDLGRQLDANDLGRDLDLVHYFRGGFPGRTILPQMVDAIALALDSAHTDQLLRALESAHACALDLIRALDLAHAIDLRHARDRTYQIKFVHAFALDAQGLGPHLVRTASFDQALDVVARVRDRALALDHARNDFTTADLSRADLDQVPLTGVRWSMATRWPSDDWQDRALLQSRELDNGVYEFRGGTANVPTHHI